jgi:ABC-type nickel/cobalt efflux system permease component RcnA
MDRSREQVHETCPGKPAARWFPVTLSRCHLVTLSVLLIVPAAGRAHPVPRKNHDRTIVVRLTPGELIVDYTLDVDEFTAVFLDLPAVMEKEDLARLRTPKEFYQAFMEHYAPILADNLVARLDKDKSLTLRSQKPEQVFTENGKPLDHLRFKFQFRAPWPADLTGPHSLAVHEGNYLYEEGLVALLLEHDGAVDVANKIVPDKALHGKLTKDLKPGEDAKRRNLSVTFIVPEERTTSSAQANSDEEPPPNLLNLLLHPGRGLWVLLTLAAGFGAVHALTPGHGKTLVAAYLVGERGTVWHALLLGLVTTLTHTGTVIALAGGLLVLYPDTVPDDIRTVLGLGGGLVIAGMGLWLLLRRLAGQADHIHLSGHNHHHHHHHHDHSYQHHVMTAHTEDSGTGRLILLGITGGIIPCWDAIAMFGFAVSAQRLWLALPLLLAFSTGLAAVLVVTGILVVKVKGFAASRWENSRLIQALPLISAFLVTVMGLWLCYDSIHQGS